MKKRVTMAGAVATAFALGVGIMVPYAIGHNPASAETDYGECYYVNNNQVSMTKNEFDLLHSIGFDDYEIENMSENKFDKLIGMGFITTQKEVRIICESDDDSMNDNGGVSLQSHITANTPTREFIVKDDTKIMYTYISFAKNGAGYKIFVKQNINWQVPPPHRLTDVIAIGYTPNIRVADNGYGSLDAEMHLRCTRVEGTQYSNVERSIYWENRNSCKRKIGEYIAYLVDISDLSDNTIIYENFCVTMEVAFDTNESTSLGTEIMPYYAHQKSGVIIDCDWGLNFSIYPPSIGFSMDFSATNKPMFDDPLFKSINIELNDAWLSRC